MKQLRFIHTADLHLDSPFKGLVHLPEPLLNQIYQSSFDSFRKIIDIAIQHQVDFILISGDLYDLDQRSLKAQLFLRKEFARLAEENIPVYIIHGNHDHLKGNWVSVNWTNNVHFFSSELECKRFVSSNGTSAHIYGFSYQEREIYERKIDHYKKIEGADFHIGMLHGQEHSITGHNPYAPFHTKELEEKDFNYWALGHIHQRIQLKPTIFYPGNIQGRHKKETGKKGCLLVEIDETNEVLVEFHETAPLLWETLEISINNIQTHEQFLAYCEQMIDDRRNLKKSAMLHLQFTGEGPMTELLEETDQIEDWITHVNEDQDDEETFVWISSYDNQTEKKWDIQQLQQQDDFLGDITRVAAGLMESSHDDVKEVLKELYNHRKAKSFLEPLSDEDYEKLLEDGRDLILKELLREWS
ncbi:metallophosphoesterase family protein [Alkalihalobacterium chitinilyticum]|uniref:DNA repair exonuclease n=1 Tax=Alkalihalobacterium chitinilyticum TaxID=2980103 RepID=A0ABT5VL28_9BACI|nr:DNA repair exonuclease [Alkalihalobacterium chitinilyticum]MDE5414959.1 DNA repair exonuclease [Alkalihalobacterium chitinilyticum]